MNSTPDVFLPFITVTWPPHHKYWIDIYYILHAI